MKGVLIVAALLLGGLQCLGQRTQQYSDPKSGFSFTYPSDFRIAPGKAATTEGWFPDEGKGEKLVKVSPIRIPVKYHGEYEFNIWVSNDLPEKCGPPLPDEFETTDNKPDTGTRVIDGTKFHHYSAVEAGMSKNISYEGYRAVIGNKCWQVQSAVYQATAYDDFKPFDHKIIDKTWQKFLDSIRISR